MLINSSPVVTIITTYLITSDGSEKEQAAHHWAGQLAEMCDCFRHNTHAHILYLKYEYAILMILCTGLPITTTIVVQWLNSLIFYNNIKCTAANGWIIIYTGVDYMSCDKHSLCANCSWKHRVIPNITLWLFTASYEWSNSISIWLHCNYSIHSAHKEITL